VVHHNHRRDSPNPWFAESYGRPICSPLMSSVPGHSGKIGH
jgi:hypothetical protein